MGGGGAFRNRSVWLFCWFVSFFVGLFVLVSPSHGCVFGLFCDWWWWFCVPLRCCVFLPSLWLVSLHCLALGLCFLIFLVVFSYDEVTVLTKSTED